MDRMIKKAMSLLLVVALLAGVFPTSAFADSGGKLSSLWGKAKETAGNAVNSATEIVGNAAETVSGFASSTADKVSELTDDAVTTASTAFDSVKQTLTKISLPDFRSGWNKATSFFGTNIAALGGQVYVNSIASAIDDLQASVSARVQGYGSGIAQKAGFAAEEWHAGTFNIDAIARGSSKNATTGNSNALGSADVSVGSEMNAGLKYFATAEDSVKAQARITQDSQGLFRKYGEYLASSGDKLSFDEWLSQTSINLDECSDLYWELYQEQIRIIPSDQIDDAKVFLKKAIAKESAKEGSNRKAMEVSYRDTLKDLSDRLEAADGTQSVPLSKKDAEAIAKAGIDNDFKPSEFGVTTSSAIKGSYVVKQAMKAGATSAIIQSALTVGPEIYEIIKYLIETGEIDKDKLKETGIDGITAAADGYLKGAISNALVIMCQSGKFGAAYTAASPELIGAMTVMVIDAIRYGIMMANGKITTEEYADIMMQEVLVSIGALGGAAIISLFFPGATLAICLGSFIGGLIVSAGYSAGKEFVLAKIDSAGVDMLVPIQASSAFIKDKAAIVTEKISDALSTIKGIDISSIKDKTIRVIDFTNAA